MASRLAGLRRTIVAAAAFVFLTSLATQTAHASEPLIYAAVTPVARAAQLNRTVTAYATIINAGTETALNCSVAMPPVNRPVTFSYRTISVNGVLGPVNTPVNIPGSNTQQNFVLSFTPTMTTAPNLALVFDCANSAPAQSVLGLNSFLINGTTFAPADVVATAVTASGDGIMNVPTNGSGFAALAAINIGTGASLTARLSAFAVGAPAATLPGVLRLCQTNPSNGQCLAPPTTDFIVFTSTPNGIVTFTAFFESNGTFIPFDPANRRVFVNFFQVTTPVGSASVAVRSQ